MIRNWSYRFVLLNLRLGQIIPQFLIGTGAPAHDVLEPVAAAAVLIAIALLALAGDRRERRAALLVGAVAIARGKLVPNPALTTALHRVSFLPSR